MRKSYPLVSCICVTKRNPEFLRRAIECFERQTYKNKELILVCEGETNNKYPLYRGAKSNVFVHCVNLDPKLSLGELRNLGIEKSSGEYFCQWDDDDWYHRERIKVQLYSAINNYKKASLLVNWIMFDSITNEAYLSYAGPWAGSLLCRRDIIVDQFRYPEINKNEDAQFVYKLYSLNCVYPIVNPSLYIYVIHRHNTWNRHHFLKLFSRSLKLSGKMSMEIKCILDEKYSHHKGSSILFDREFLTEVNYFFQLANKTVNKIEI